MEDEPPSTPTAVCGAATTILSFSSSSVRPEANEISNTREGADESVIDNGVGPSAVASATPFGADGADGADAEAAGVVACDPRRDALKKTGVGGRDCDGERVRTLNEEREGWEGNDCDDYRGSRRQSIDDMISDFECPLEREIFEIRDLADTLGVPPTIAASRLVRRRGCVGG